MPIVAGNPPPSPQNAISSSKGITVVTIPTTALVVIDAQTSLIDEGPWESGAVLGRIVLLLARARSAGAFVIFVTDRRVAPDGFIHRSLDVRPGDPVVSKGFADSFFGTDLDELLRARRVRSIVVAGLQTDYCVDTTCRRAVTLGYDVLLVSDAHTTFDHEALTAPQIVAHHNRVLRDFHAGSARVRVVPAAEVSFS